jgi:hypothetical protein
MKSKDLFTEQVTQMLHILPASVPGVQLSLSQ